MTDSRNRVARWFAIGAAAIAIAACSGSKDAPTQSTGGGGGTTTPPGSPVGSFSLSTVNAKPLPYTMYADTGGYTVEITAGTFVVQSAGKYIATTTSRETLVGIISIYVDSTFGTWTQSSASQITFTNTADGTTQTAAWDGTKMTAIDASSASTLVYLKSP